MAKSSKKNQKNKIVGLIIALMVVLVGGVLFMGAVSGWFEDSKVVLSSEYYSENPEFIDLDINEYEELLKARKSFLVFVDNTSCTTADRVRRYVSDYMKEQGVKVYKVMFKDIKDSSLHDYIKYYPSVVVVDKGRVRTYLRADSDEDSDEYNDYESFKSWLDQNF